MIKGCLYRMIKNRRNKQYMAEKAAEHRMHRDQAVGRYNDAMAEERKELELERKKTKSEDPLMELLFLNPSLPAYKKIEDKFMEVKNGITKKDSDVLESA